jgi:hypothetical protein
MAVESWKLWIIPLGLWGLYLCWHCGYQSGYAEGHETAWRMSRPSAEIRIADNSAASLGDLVSEVDEAPKD